MKTNKFYIFLIVLSLIFTIYHTYEVIQILNNKGENLYLKFSLIFSNLGLISIFFYFFNKKYKEIYNSLPKLFSKTIPVILLVSTVIYLSAYNYILVENGLSNGKQLYWQIFSILLALGVIRFIYFIMVTFENKKVL
jgi:hypothetical protein